MSDPASHTASVVYLLDLVAPFAPPGLLQTRFTQIISLLSPVLLPSNGEGEAAAANIARHAIGAVETLLLAQTRDAWERLVDNTGSTTTPRQAVASLLVLALDHRPKVRKRALDAVRNVLARLPPGPAVDHPAAGMCAETAMRSLEALAARNSHANSGKKKGGGEVKRHDPDMMHALQLVKAVASAAGWPSRKTEPLCELLLDIARTGNEHMTVAVFDVFEIIFAGLAADDAPASNKLARLLEVVAELRPAPDDTMLLPPWIAILSRGYEVAARLEPDETFEKLPELFSLVRSFMESPAKNIRISASECLVSFAANCVPARVILEPSIYDEKVLEKVAAIVEGLLSVRYQAAWLESFNVLGAMFDALRWRAYPSMLNITKTVGEIRGNESFVGKEEADEVIGKAIRAMGPEAVLGVVPLNLAKPTKGQPGRAWMLPLLRDYTSNTNLNHFRTELLPLSELMFQKVLEHGEAEKTMEVKIYETVVQQIWSILPGYCDLPLDLTAAFDQTFGELLANVLYQQTNLRLDICRALRVLVESNEAIASIEDEEENLILQSRVSKAMARENIEHLRRFAGNLLAVLFNVYSQTLPQSRGPILQTINAYLAIIPENELVETFDRVSKMLAAELQQTPEPAKGAAKPPKSNDQLPSTTHTLMDLVITMSVHLPRQCYGALFEIASVVVVRDDDPQLQKKAYKLIPRLAESATGEEALKERSGELQAFLLSSAEKVSAPAARDRLAAIAALIPYVSDKSLHFIPSVLSEVVISCKEHNERARSTAFDLLVLMGHRMAEAKGSIINNSKVPHMPKGAPNGTANIEEFFTMVSAGLAGNTPHMISASVTALARLLHEFHAEVEPRTVTELVETMDLFLTSNNREIVKSVLGFVKVCVVTLPAELMTPRLPSLIPNLLVWGKEHKGHFKAKVKHMMERMIRRFGYDTVYKYCPEDDRKLLVNIRKTKERAKRQKEAQNHDDEDEDEDGGDPRSRFESGYDEALYSSDESGDSGDQDDVVRHLKRGGKKAGGNAYILQDDDEPLDLLDRNALAKISSTRPVKVRRAGTSKAKVDLDGKLILGDAKGAVVAGDDDDDAMEVDLPKGETGVGAYVAALKGRDVPRRGLRGKLKFSNKRQKDDEDDDMEDDSDDDQGKASDNTQGATLRRSSFGKRGGTKVSRPRAFSGPTKAGSRSGKGHIASGRRGLGEEKRRGPSMSGRISKPHEKRR